MRIFCEMTGHIFVGPGTADGRSGMWFADATSGLRQFVTADAIDAVVDAPPARAARFQAAWGLPEHLARTIVFEMGNETADYFEDLVELGAPVLAAAKLLLNPLRALLRQRQLNLADLPLTPRQVADVAQLYDARAVQNFTVPLLLRQLLTAGPDADARRVATAHGWLLCTADTGIDAEIEAGDWQAVVRQVVAEQSAIVERIFAGHERAINRLVGIALQRTNGRVAAEHIRDSIRDALGR